MSRTRSVARVLPMCPPPAVPGVVVGRVIEVVEVAAGVAPVLLVEVHGHGVVRARLAVAMSAAQAQAAAAARCEVTLVCEDGDPGRALVIGVVQAQWAAQAAGTEARVDGRRVVIEGKEEVVLRCGAATITLHASGKLVIRGATVETRASGTNRIKGGSVQIN